MTDQELEIIKKVAENGVYIKRLRPRQDELGILKCVLANVDFTQFNEIGVSLNVFGCIGYHFNWRDDEYIYDEKYLRNPKSHKLYSKCYSYGRYDSFTLYLNDYGKASNDSIRWGLTREELENET